MLGVAGSCWELLEVAGSRWKSLEVAGSCWEVFFFSFPGLLALAGVTKNVCGETQAVFKVFECRVAVCEAVRGYDAALFSSGGVQPTC